MSVAPRPSAIAAPRAVAFEVVRATFERGAYTEQAFRRCADERELPGRERAQAQRLAYGTVQRRAVLDAAAERLTERAPRLLDPPVIAALRIGLYEILFADATPDHAAVDQAVELAKAGGAAHAAGLVNAVLRRAVRERAGLRSSLLEDDSTPETAAIAHSVPLWLARMWWEEVGPESARSLMAACNRATEVALRVNTLRMDREAAISRLCDAGVKARRPEGEWPLSADETIAIEGRTGNVVPEMVVGGLLTPQSLGSAAVVEVLDPQPGEYVLDLCAGPGIKTGQIAARMRDRGEIISVEADAARAGEVAAQARRLGLRSVSVVEADASAPMAPGFDRVLVDAPCSDLGTLSTRPDARWRKSPAAIERLVEVQRRILVSAASALRPGGVLVYSTCTISRRENEDSIAGLLEAAIAGDAPRLTVEDLGGRAPGLASPIDARCLQLRPDRDRTTGFFICRLRRDDAGP